MYLSSDEVVELLFQVTDQLLPLVSPEILSNIHVSNKCALNDKTKTTTLGIILKKKGINTKL